MSQKSKFTRKFRLYTGPSLVKQTAERLREAGIDVTVEGTEHIHFMANDDRDGITLKLRDILGSGYGVKNVQHIGAEIIQSDNDLSKLMELAVPETEGETHVVGPEAGPSNDELHENSHPQNGPEGSPVFDGDLKHPERQNTNAIREALETQVEMEVGKPINQKQEEVAAQEAVQDAALAQGAGGLAGGAPAASVQEVSAKPGTQVIINIGAKQAATMADRLMLLENKIWDKLGIESGGQLMEDPQLAASYHSALDQALVKVPVVPQKVLDVLTNENYHQLVKYLTNRQAKSASVKVAYVSHCPGHTNSKGEKAEWCIKQHNTDKILESFKSEGAAKEGLKNMESHKGSKSAAQSADWCDNCIFRLHPQILMSHAPGPEFEQMGKCERCGNKAALRAVQVPMEKQSDTVQAESIGGENQPGATAGHAGGMFGGTDLEGPSFKDKFAVEFTFRGTPRSTTFSSVKEAHAFIKSASTKFGKVAGDFVMKCPSCQGQAKKDKHEDSYKCQCGWNSHTAVSEKPTTPKSASVKKANEVVMLEQSNNPVNSIIEAVFSQLLANNIASYDMHPDIMARAVSRLKSHIKKTRRGEIITYEVNVPELKKTFKLQNPSKLQAIDDFKQNPYKDEATGLPKSGAGDPAKRNLVLEILKGGPKTTGEIEKALGGGKYTNKAWPILNELSSEGLLKHKQMRWHLKTAEWKGWSYEMPVEVVTDKGYDVYSNLEEAKQYHPTLDPEHNTQDFTWAMRGEVHGMPAIRFETWPANKMYSASVKKATFGKKALSIETRVSEMNKTDVFKAIVDAVNDKFAQIKQQNPQGHMDSFEQQLPTIMMDIAQGMGLQMDYTPESDTYLFYDQTASGTKDKSYEELTAPPAPAKQEGVGAEGGMSMASLKKAAIRITSVEQMPRSGTPESAELKIAIQTLKMPEAIAAVMGGPSVEDAHRTLARYGLAWDEEAYMAGGKGVKKAGNGMAKTIEIEAATEKEAGFNFFFPGQVLKEFYPEIQHEIVDYPNSSNQPMSGAGNPEIVGDGGHELEGILDEALDTNVVEMIQLPADVGEVEPMAMAAADYSSTSPAGGMGIGRDGKPEVLEGAPLRKENDIRGYMFTDEFYGQYEGIPGAAMNVASKTAAEGDEGKQFGMFLKKVCGEIAATLVAAFKVTTRPLLDKVPGMGEIQLDIIEQGSQAMPLGQTIQGGRVKYLMDALNDGDIKAAINDAWAQAAVWNDNPEGGFVYEVFVRPETIDTDSLQMKYKFVCGTRE